MKIKELFIGIVVMITISGCSTTPRKVIDRSDGFSDRPEWALDTADLKESGGKIWIVGDSRMDASDNRNSCVKSAIQKARENLAAQLNIKIDSKAQNYISKGDDEFNQTISTIVSQNVPGSKVEGQYWEIEQTKKDDRVDAKMYCYAKVSLEGEIYRKILKKIVDSTTNNEIKKAMEDEAIRFISTEKKEQ